MNPFRYYKAGNNHDSREHTPDFCSFTGGSPIGVIGLDIKRCSRYLTCGGISISAYPTAAALTRRAKEARLLKRPVFWTH